MYRLHPTLNLLCATILGAATNESVIYSVEFQNYKIGHVSSFVCRLTLTRATTMPARGSYVWQNAFQPKYHDWAQKKVKVMTIACARKWKWWQVSAGEGEIPLFWHQPSEIKTCLANKNYHLMRTWNLSPCIRSEFDRWKSSTATCDNYKRKHTKNSEQGSPVTKLLPSATNQGENMKSDTKLVFDFNQIMLAIGCFLHPSICNRKWK